MNAAAENVAEKSTSFMWFRNREGWVACQFASSRRQSRKVSEVKQRWEVAEGGGGLEWWSRFNDTLWMWGLEGHVNTDLPPRSALLCWSRNHFLLILKSWRHVPKTHFNPGRTITNDARHCTLRLYHNGGTNQDLTRRHLSRGRTTGANNKMEQPVIHLQRHIWQVRGLCQQKSRQSEHHWRGKEAVRRTPSYSPYRGAGLTMA